MTGPDRELRVIVPDEPPRLNPGAARVLLRILRKADSHRHGTRKTRDKESS
jgi:hypothetical protein